MNSLHPVQKRKECSNIIPFRGCFLPYHHTYLKRWFEASVRMGICDIEVRKGDSKISVDHILIWVRENANPAYIVRPLDHKWEVFDYIQKKRLGVYSIFEQALNSIRPVLSPPL
ncbi:MAG: hypothetical protein ACRCVY_04795 [Commensalibacter sp.]|nr:hypothetical protein [Commensalibacter sp.]